ncbi:MAG: rhodanese-like domain-containing protein [Candidatus Eisenbacteria bacterium]|uniref:Rhodanese-like domain-containing protein n=1 Tax=Eiseniibacteriota bacterium TaxID=2212470 RepID=A0A849SFM0_UNCEI|nr:rhodanese-like domain-containing protein [Candidatus Eisenbacteria bacterium]
MRNLCQHPEFVSRVSTSAFALALALLTGCGNSGSGGRAAVSGTRSATHAAVSHIDAASARTFLDENSEALLLDVRNPKEWKSKYPAAPGAMTIPLPELHKHVGELAAWKDKPIFTVCHSGSRSLTAAEMLADSGFRDVRSIDGGMVAWKMVENLTAQ